MKNISDEFLRISHMFEYSDFEQFRIIYGPVQQVLLKMPLIQCESIHIHKMDRVKFICRSNIRL